MSQQLKDYVRNHRHELLPRVQAIYEKHGITVESFDSTGATLRFSQGTDALADAIAEEAELLADLVGQPQPQPETLDEDEEIIEEDAEIPPPPPGAGPGKWSGSWSPRTWTGTFTEEK
jgi:hypothetical protein